MPGIPNIFLQSTFLRFLISGGFNTALTYALYLLLLIFLPYEIAYTISYLSGILIAYIFSRYFVFKKSNGLKSKILFPLIYVIQYGIGLAVIWFCIEKIGLPEWIAPIISICATIPLTYLLSKILFLGKGSQ